MQNEECLELSSLFQKICFPTGTRLTTKKLTSTKTKPTIDRNAIFLPLHPIVRRCRSTRYVTQVMRDHVSFGSQLQYVPQAISAQMEPVIIPRVNSGQPNDIALYPSVSITSSDGSRRKIAPHCLALSWRSCIRYMMETIKAKANAASPRNASVVW